MADDLAALRRRQKEDRLRKREQERKRRREKEERCTDNDGDNVTSKLSFNRNIKKSYSDQLQNLQKNVSEETLSTSEAARRKRVKRLREEKKTEEALRLIKKMYPDTMKEVSTHSHNNNDFQTMENLSEELANQKKTRKKEIGSDVTTKSPFGFSSCSSSTNLGEFLCKKDPEINAQHFDNPKMLSKFKRTKCINDSSTNIKTKLKTTKKPPLHQHSSSNLNRSYSWMSLKKSQSSYSSLETSMIYESSEFNKMINLDSPPKPLSMTQIVSSSTESSKTNNTSFSSKASNRSSCQKILFQPNASLNSVSHHHINKCDGSSSDEDLLSLAQQIQSSKDRKRNFQKERLKNVLKSDLMASAKKLYKPKIQENGNNDNDLPYSARKISQKSHYSSTCSLSPNSKNSTSNNKSKIACVLSGSKEIKGIRFSQLSDLDNSSDEDLLNQSYILAEKSKMRIGRDKAIKTTPNNPIALRLRQEENNHSDKDCESTKGLRQQMSKFNDTNIWSDSDDEEQKDKNGVKRKKKNTVESFKKIATTQKSEGCKNNGEESEEEREEYDTKLKPEFSNPKLGPPSALEPFPLQNDLDEIHDSDHDEGISNGNNLPRQHQIPASINRYLKDYQREGIQFLYSLVSRNKGAILGDDMGLGKTIQIISLIAALQMKTGTNLDIKNIRERQKKISKDLIKIKDKSDQAILRGTLSICEKLRSSNFTRAIFSPILIVVPPSIIDNFLNEFNTWGHFAVSVFQGKDRIQALEQIKNGYNDILIIGRSLFSVKATIEVLEQITWKLIVVDEFHEYKNAKSRSYTALSKIQRHCECPIVGMTGTVMPNDQKELYVLVDLVQPGLLGDAKSFNKHISIPMKLARTKDAKDDVLRLGKRRREELDRALKGVYLKRNKIDVLNDTLTEKKETVIICALSDIQKELYKQVLKLPDYLLLRLSNSPCDCGVNQNFFIGYKKMRSKKEQIEYQRRHKDDLIIRKKCCYRVPLNHSITGSNSDRIDPKAVLWLSSHPTHQECEKCPSCILLPALQKLYKICSHASLLQAGKDPDRVKHGTNEWSKFKTEVEFAKAIMTPTIVSCLPGKSYIREDSIMDDHLALSGKMQALDKCLQLYYQNRDKALIFSYSTSTLDLIQHYVRSKGYSFLRLDGSTPTKKRQPMVDKFQENSEIFLFLISTKAGGLGLNLTAANKVIIYDVNWNPSHDSQAQDRSFRIGQLRNVDVIRLVARGTIEELMYARQIYKAHLTKETLGGICSGETSNPARIFRGVDKDPKRKGELFGSENLLKFKDGSFLAEMWKSNNSSKNNVSNSKHEEINAVDVADALSKMTQNEIENLGDDIVGIKKGKTQQLEATNINEENDNQNCSVPNLDEVQLPKKRLSDLNMSCILNHDDLLRADRGQAALCPGDDGFEEEMGGASQMVHVTCALACESMKLQLEKAESSVSSERIRKTLSSRHQGQVLNADQRNGKKFTSNFLSEKRGNRNIRRLETVCEQKVLKKRKNLEIMGSIVKEECRDSDAKLSTSHQIYIPSYLRKKRSFD